MRLLTLLPGLVLGLVMALVTGMWQFALFTFVSVASAALTSALLKRKRREPDLDFSDQPIWISPRAVAIGDRVLPRSGWFFKEHFSEIFFEYATRQAVEIGVSRRSKELEENYFKATNQGELPFWAGIAESANLQFDLVKDGPHALIIGSTGAGKSELLRLITCSMLASSDKPLELVLIDFKGGAGLREINRHPWALTLLTDLDADRHQRFWLYLAGELKTREQLLAKLGAASIAEAGSLKRMVVLADELPAIISSSPLALVTLETIAARGRSLGVHLIATSQSLAGIPRSLITNLTLRFAIGVTDPGDLISLMPTLKTPSVKNARAFAVWGTNTSWFDFPIVRKLPNLGEGKADPQRVAAWTDGLPESYPADQRVIGLIDIPTDQRTELLTLEDISGKSLLVVGAANSGKTTFIELLRSKKTIAEVLDCPTVAELEHSFQSGKSVWCSVSSSTLLPLAIQRRFELIIYLRQGNLDQHLAAGLPKASWREDLPPGRGWLRGLAIQLARPALIPEQQRAGYELAQPVR